MRNKLLSLLLALCMLVSLSLPALALGEGTDAAEPALAPSYLETAGGGAYEAMRLGLLAGEERIDLEPYGLTIDALTSLFATLYYSEAELFFISAGYSYSKTSDGRVVALTPTYLCEVGEIPALLDEFYAMTDAILAEIPAKLSELGRVAWVHDYIAQSFVYDNTYTNYDVYSMLKTGTGVCQPYSLLARYLLRSLGIETECVTSDALSHEWNTVRLGDAWYHMDITWDDCDDEGFYGQVSHLYFLCSDAEFARGEHASEWIAPAACDDTRYDGDFADVSTAFVPVDGLLYAIEGGAVSRYEEETGEFTALHTIGEIWHTYLSATGWQGTFSGLFYVSGRLIYNTENELRYYAPESGESGRIATLKTVGGYIYGMYLDGNDLVYALKREPNAKDFSPYRTRLVYQISWVIGENTYTERYLYGDTPTCKQSTELPEDSHRFTFIGWDKAIAKVSEDAVYTAEYASVELYPASAEELIALTLAASEEGLSLSERFPLLSEALAMQALVNPAYEGVAEAKVTLAALIKDYNEEAAAFYFAGWVPSR